MSDEENSEEELDLSTLGDEDLTAQMHDDLYDGLADEIVEGTEILLGRCLLYTSPSPRDRQKSRMPSSA